MLGSRDAIDWDESWRIKTVNDAEWNDLRQELRTAYRAVVEHLRTLDKWGEDEFGLTMARVAHSAYHLGAIRQLLRPRSRTGIPACLDLMTDKNVCPTDEQTSASFQFVCAV